MIILDGGTDERHSHFLANLSVEYRYWGGMASTEVINLLTQKIGALEPGDIGQGRVAAAAMISQYSESRGAFMGPLAARIPHLGASGALIGWRLDGREPETLRAARRAQAALARGAYLAESPLAPAVFIDGVRKSGGIEVRPEAVDEVQFGIGAFPQ